MKTAQCESKAAAHKKLENNSRLDFVFLPTGNLYTHMFEKAIVNENGNKGEETCTDIMRNLMKTFQSDYSKLSTVSNTKSMLSHYCNEDSSCPESPIRKPFKEEFDSAGKSN